MTEIARDPRHNYIYSVTDVEAFDRVQEGCREGTIAHIELKYVDRLRNPADEDWNEITVRCLVRNGVTRPDYSAADYVRDSMRNFNGAPFDKESPAVADCLANPSA